MPKVPYSNNVVPLRPQGDQPAPEFLAMAAAVMHEQNRLFEIETPNVDVGKSESSSKV